VVVDCLRDAVLNSALTVARTLGCLGFVLLSPVLATFLQTTFKVYGF
jgi:hypothetical protein